MSCCMPSQNRGTSAPPQLGRVGAAGRAFSEAPRAHFADRFGHVGTDHPVIAEDGEGPRRRVALNPFALECHTVTNWRFAEFVAATGYITEAEEIGWSTVFRGLLPADAPYPPAIGPTPWWIKVDGACWREPEGPGSSVGGSGDHPVIHVSLRDAQAFAVWAGGRIPREAEWEHAARGGLNDPRYPWGDDEPDDTRILCNIWQGRFPERNTGSDGYLGTAPVDAFVPNNAGLFGMAGNVWEWTIDGFRIRSLGRQAKLRNAYAAQTGEHVLKGGSFLCHRSYCFRYRIAARIPLTRDSAASNVGFRVAYDA